MLIPPPSAADASGSAHSPETPAWPSRGFCCELTTGAFERPAEEQADRRRGYETASDRGQRQQRRPAEDQSPMFTVSQRPLEQIEMTMES